MTDDADRTLETPDDADRTRAERYRLVAEIEAVLDGPTTYLALLFAALLVAEIALTAQNMAVPAVLGWIQLAIWAVFVVHFLLGITISPDRGLYLRRNWLTALSLIVPFLATLGAISLTRLPVEFQKLIAEELVQMRPSLEAKALRLHEEWPAEPVHVLGDGAAADHAGKEEQLKSAMEKISKYKQKYSSVSSIKDLPKRPTNPMKSKRFIERLVPGLYLQYQQKNFYLLDVNPYVGYKLTGRFTTGFGWNHRYAYDKDSRAFNSRSRIFGPRGYVDFKLGKGLSGRNPPSFQDAVGACHYLAVGHQSC